MVARETSRDMNMIILGRATLSRHVVHSIAVCYGRAETERWRQPLPSTKTRNGATGRGRTQTRKRTHTRRAGTCESEMYNLGDSHAHAPLKAEARGVFFFAPWKFEEETKVSGMIEIVLGRDSIDGEYGDKFVLAVSLTEEYFS